jgi:hypothetical protein
MDELLNDAQEKADVSGQNAKDAADDEDGLQQRQKSQMGALIRDFHFRLGVVRELVNGHGGNGLQVNLSACLSNM